MRKSNVHIVGGGLAGCEAAWQLAKRGIPVRLFEMKPEKMSPAHSSGMLAELVCSNSLRSDRLVNAAGLLKEELRLLDSLVMRAADAVRVPAGGALAVNRDEFSAYITDEMERNGNVELVREEVVDLSRFEDGEIVIIASGPLTSDALADAIQELTGGFDLHFFDAAAPIVSADSVDMTRAFTASRYDRGSDYVNCPMTREEYAGFYDALVNAECVALRDFEHTAVFEGCMPVETMAKRGVDTLRYGPLKPKGLIDPATGKEPYAVVQLRKEDRGGTLYNLVGFQTNLLFGEQKRVFGLIPALKHAEFLRYGVMHRNTYLNSPVLLDAYYRLLKKPEIRFAGQISGVEGYVESTASGLLCGLCAAFEREGRPLPVFGTETAIGALGAYVAASASKNFQPMNINFGIMDPLGMRVRNKEEKNTMIAERALTGVKAVIEQFDI